MKKFKQSIFVLLVAFGITFSNVSNQKIFANLVSKPGIWQEETTTVKGSIDFITYRVEFGYGPTHQLEGGKAAASQVELSKPNVYIKHKDGRIVNHIWLEEIMLHQGFLN